MDSLREIQASAVAFAAKRAWSSDHTAKNLLMALTVEVAELVEIFQWKTPDQALRENLTQEEVDHAGQELADILSYVVQLAAILDIDLGSAYDSKAQLNAAKHPEVGG